MLNERFRPHNISFHVKKFTQRTNPDWSGSTKEQLDLIRKSRWGWYNWMNVYVVPSLPGKLKGRGRFPKPGLIPGSPEFLRDGILIRSDAVTGGTDSKLDLGMVLVHEAGHWLGREYPHYIPSYTLRNQTRR